MVYIIFLTLTLGATNPASVSITLTTSVPGYLYHGFLNSPGVVGFVETDPTVNDAFNEAGAVLNYGIKTNVGIPLIVKATIDPFKEQDVADPATVPITKVEVASSSGSTTNYMDVDGKYQILQLTPQSGTVFYSYILTVFADQARVLASPSGNYVSTVSIDIATEN